MKNKVIMVVIVLFLLILLVPKTRYLNDGGTVEYKAFWYNVTRLHRLNDYSPTGYDEGTKIEILGIEVYNDIIINIEPVEVNKIENVLMTIKEGTLTNTGATVVITDTNTNKHTFNSEYRIDKKVNDGWVEAKRIDNNFAFKDLAWVAGDDNTITNNLNWEKLYGELEKGQYRIVKKVDGKMFCAIQVEFEIK